MVIVLIIIDEICHELYCNMKNVIKIFQLKMLREAAI